VPLGFRMLKTDLTFPVFTSLKTKELLAVVDSKCLTIYRVDKGNLFRLY